MSVLGRIKDFFSGKSAVEEPVALDMRYVIRDRSGGSKWPGGISASGSPTAVAHFTARQNARNAMQDSVQARSMVGCMANTVADVGLRPELTPRVDILGITPERGAEWAKDVEERFDLFARDKRQCRSEISNFYKYQRVYQFYQHRDNDIFTRLFYDPDPTLQSPLQFDTIDPDQIRFDAYTTTLGPQYQNDGIERDARGREDGYKIWIRQEDGTCKEFPIRAKDPVSGKRLMLHGFHAEYAGQGRGFSRLAHALQEFENLTDFSAATIKKAINQSQIVGFVEPSKDEDAQDIFSGVLTNQGAGPAAEQFGASPSPTADAQNVTDDAIRPIVECYQVPEATNDTPGSMFINNLTRGSKIVFPATTAPGDSFDKFVDAFSYHLSASMGLPLEVVLKRFNQNYSASRATLLLFWREVEIWRKEMADDLLDPVFEEWLACEIGAGRIVAPGWSDPVLRAAWLAKNWIGSAIPDIDPSKTADARRKNIEIGITSTIREARNYNGSSAEHNMASNKALWDGFTLAPWMKAPTPVVGVNSDVTKVHSNG